MVRAESSRSAVFPCHGHGSGTEARLANTPRDSPSASALFGERLAETDDRNRSHRVGDDAFGVNSSEKKSLTFKFDVENVTNSGDTVELYLELSDPFNNTAGDDSLFVRRERHLHL